jgi:hypothetical protein
LMLKRPIQAHKSYSRARPSTPTRPLHARTRSCLREIPFTLAHTLLLARRQRLNTNPSEKSRNLHPCISGTHNSPRSIHTLTPPPF